jgi:eukaryotic-like serine/threonine-protein kinase
MALKTRVWGAGKILLLTGALAATFLVFAFGSMRLALKTREVDVPDLINRSANEATVIANGMGLAVRVDDTRRPDPKVAAGLVLAQDPAAGSVSRSQRSIRVWLSSGVRAAMVPPLVGETERAAGLRVAQDGLTLDGVAEIRSPDYPPDVVVAQMPPAKTATERVSLLVNRGEHGASYVMPDLIGVNGDRAGEILRGHGFRVAVVASNPYPGVAAGIVLRQSPQGGFRIAPGEPISLEVSR